MIRISGIICLWGLGPVSWVTCSWPATVSRLRIYPELGFIILVWTGIRPHWGLSINLSTDLRLDHRHCHPGASNHRCYPRFILLFPVSVGIHFYNKSIWVFSRILDRLWIRRGWLSRGSLRIFS